MNDVRGYAEWNVGNTSTASLSFVDTAEALRAEHRSHRILTVDEAIDFVAAGCRSASIPSSAVCRPRWRGPTSGRWPSRSCRRCREWARLLRGTCDMTIRVVHCGTGLTGREALRAIIEDPALELVGQYVSTPEKIGKDAGELSRGPADRRARDRASTRSSPSVPTASSLLCRRRGRREHDAVDEMARFLRAGTNVVTFAVV